VKLDREQESLRRDWQRLIKNPPFFLSEVCDLARDDLMIGLIAGNEISASEQ
jgi:hypothetical protein